LPPAAAAPPPPASDIRGLVDNASATHLYGWVFNRLVPGQRIRVELMFGEVSLGRTLADMHRPDLQPNGIGDGQHGFEFAVSAELMARLDQLEVIALPEDGKPFPLPIRLHGAPPQPAASTGGSEAVILKARPIPDEAPAVAQPSSPVPEAVVPAAVTATAGPVAEMLEPPQPVDDLKQRVEALEIWLARVDRQLVEAQSAPAASLPTSDNWQKLLFGMLVASLLLSVGISYLFLR
jgi:hypothetical protein